MHQYTIPDVLLPVLSVISDDGEAEGMLVFARDWCAIPVDQSVALVWKLKLHPALVLSGVGWSLLLIAMPR